MAKSSQIVSLQYLRGVAALLVIVHHALDQFPSFRLALPTNTGASGVDIFFVISGFVMTYTTQVHNYSRGEFLLRRAVRVVPIYWIVTLFTAVLLTIGTGLVRHSIFDPVHLLASLLFWPMHNPGEIGTITPTVKLGWTLNYEMFFYLLFAAFLSFRPPARAFLITITFAVLCFGAVLAPDAPTPIVFWGNPIVFEFLFGCLLAQFYFAGLLRLISWRLLAAIGLFGAAGLVVAGFDGALGFNAVGAIRPLVFGLPAALVVLSFLGGKEEEGANRKGIWLLHLIGDASYSIYLTHLFAVIFMRILWSRFGLPEEGVGWALLFVSICFAVGTGFGCLIYLTVEKPATNLAKGWLLAKSARLPGVT